MNAAEVIAYTYDGAEYCPDCLIDDDGEEVGVIFAETEEQHRGMTCGTCGKCYTAAGWERGSDARDPASYLWSRCDSCNHQEPHCRGDAAREAAELRRYGCRGCGRKDKVWLNAHQLMKYRRTK